MMQYSKVLPGLLALVLGGSLVSYAADAPRSVRQLQFHGSATPLKPGQEIGFVDVVKKAKLSEYPEKTIGDAFEAYRHFARQDWKETRVAGGKVYVDVTGWFKSDLLDFEALRKKSYSKGVGVKFLVQPNGNFAAVMASQVEIGTDGVLRSTPLEDLNGILKSIYTNKELKK